MPVKMAAQLGSGVALTYKRTSFIRVRVGVKYHNLLGNFVSGGQDGRVDREGHRPWANPYFEVGVGINPTPDGRGSGRADDFGVIRLLSKKIKYQIHCQALGRLKMAEAAKPSMIPVTMKPSLSETKRPRTLEGVTSAM